MKALVLDIETVVQFIDEENEGKTRKVKDNSPFNPANAIVSVNFRKIENGVIGADNCVVFHHKEQPVPDSPASLQQALDWADIVVAHNAKFDVMYLLEAGFRLPSKVYCTMIGEYILARGVDTELSLDATAKRRGVTFKKGELIDQYFDDGIGFEAMPLVVVKEYAEADVLSCAEIYLAQLSEFGQEDSLNNIVELMNDMLLFIVEIERNGIKIDLDQLEKVRIEYETERQKLLADMQRIAEEVMGDTPVNFNSAADISKLVYSRELIDPKYHRQVFNIGTDFRGKKLRPPNMSPNKFAETVRKTTRRICKTVAQHCVICDGKGSIRKIKKNGEAFKRDNVCNVCQGRGYVLYPTQQTAGLKLVPTGPEDASFHGFNADKDQIDKLIYQAKEKDNLIAIEFLTKKKRLNAVNTYLNSFVNGIQRWTRADHILHSTFNQCITATARLSSSNPNFQNQPKGKKFPVRKAVVSRFDGGLIMEADFSGLEFVVAGELSRDPQIIEDILSGKDIHAQTARIVHELPDDGRNWKDGSTNENMRSEVKPHTFAPLYGATGANLPAHIARYYKEFFNVYKRHGEWQLEQMNNVIQKGFIRTPSGREYAFPGTRRLRFGRTTNATRIVNYPVQGFATGDIVPLACVRALRAFRQLGLQSKLVLTVHDSIVADVHPDEVEQVYNALKWALEGCVGEIKQRWGYEMMLPLKCEIQAGKSWGALEHIHANDNLELREILDKAA